MLTSAEGVLKPPEEEVGPPAKNLRRTSQQLSNLKTKNLNFFHTGPAPSSSTAIKSSTTTPENKELLPDVKKEQPEPVILKRESVEDVVTPSITAMRKASIGTISEIEATKVRSSLRRKAVARLIYFFFRNFK